MDAARNAELLQEAKQRTMEIGGAVRYVPGRSGKMN